MHSVTVNIAEIQEIDAQIANLTEQRRYRVTAQLQLLKNEFMGTKQKLKELARIISETDPKWCPDAYTRALLLASNNDENGNGDRDDTAKPTIDVVTIKGDNVIADASTVLDKVKDILNLR